MDSAHQQTHPASPTSDEIMMAALAHGSALLSFFGPIGPLLVWVGQRRKSSYASFHALQAFGYQMAFYWIGIAVGMIVAIIWMLRAMPEMVAAMQSDPADISAFYAFEKSLMTIALSTWGIYSLGGIAGAVLCLVNKDMRYPWFGKRLATYVRFESATGGLDEVAVERFVAAMSHGSAILLLWGLIAPLIIWVTQKERSPYLRFQGLQATVYQALATAGYFVFLAVTAILTTALLAVLIQLPNMMGRTENDSSTLIVLLVVLVLNLLLLIVFALAVPTYHLFALIAGIQILKGRDYRYPLLGSIIARRMKLDPHPKE